MLDEHFNTTYQERCAKCRGTGKFQTPRFSGPCFSCKGVGHKTFRSAPDERIKAREKYAAKKVRTAIENKEFFSEKYPEIWGWMTSCADRFDFARAVVEAVTKYGELTERQMDTCQRLHARDMERAAARFTARQNAPVIDTTPLMQAFEKAKASGLQYPKMRFDGFQCSMAGANSKNSGAIYVKDGETYLGKIADGKFCASRECLPLTGQLVIDAMQNPLEAAVAYGRRTGNCSCCGRGLVNVESVANGIGPICAEKFGL